jgi:hypothetical protein
MGRTHFSGSGGTGTLKNDRSETIAEGNLTSNEQVFLAIKGKRDATFTHNAKNATFADNTFAKKEATEFASVELSSGNRWTLKDDNFYFALELPDATRPRIVVDLDESLARASIITFPNGVVKLWGYSVTVEKSKGTVKFAHGKIIEATDASYEKAQ